MTWLLIKRCAKNYWTSENSETIVRLWTETSWKKFEFTGCLKKRGLQLWKIIQIYTEDIHNVSNCHNVETNVQTIQYGLLCATRHRMFSKCISCFHKTLNWTIHCSSFVPDDKLQSMVAVISLVSFKTNVIYSTTNIQILATKHMTAPSLKLLFGIQTVLMDWIFVTTG
jgi:hypothetical protein